MDVTNGPFVDGLWTARLKSASEPRKSWISGYRAQDRARYITSCPERQRTRTVRSVLAVTTKRRVLAPGGRDREGERFLRAFAISAQSQRDCWTTDGFDPPRRLGTTDGLRSTAAVSDQRWLGPGGFGPGGFGPPRRSFGSTRRN